MYLENNLGKIIHEKKIELSENKSSKVGNKKDNEINHTECSLYLQAIKLNI
jgi:hypothetical protein